MTHFLRAFHPAAVLLLASLALPAGAGRGTGVSDPAAALHRSLPAGRLNRHHGPHRGRRAD
jgi:hypothetical protein